VRFSIKHHDYFVVVFHVHKSLAQPAVTQRDACSLLCVARQAELRLQTQKLAPKEQLLPVEQSKS
jgi:hypothetical protein